MSSGCTGSGWPGEEKGGSCTGTPQKHSFKIAKSSNTNTFGHFKMAKCANNFTPKCFPMTQPCHVQSCKGNSHHRNGCGQVVGMQLNISVCQNKCNAISMCFLIFFFLYFGRHFLLNNLTSYRLAVGIIAPCDVITSGRIVFETLETCE